MAMKKELRHLDWDQVKFSNRKYQKTMKLNYIQNLFSALLMGTVLFVSCADDAILDTPEALVEMADDAPEVWTLTAKLGNPEADSRLAYYKMPGAFMTIWESTDQLAANPSPGSTSSTSYIYNLTEGSGTSNGVFQYNGSSYGGPSKTRSSKWTIYYPGNKIKNEQAFFNMSYLGQIQSGNDNYDHIADYHALRLPYGNGKTKVYLNNVLIDLSSDDVQESACMQFNLSGFPTSIVPVKVDLEYLAPSGGNSCVFYTHNYSPSYWSGATLLGSTTSRLSLALEDFESTRSITAYMMMSSYPVSVQKGGTFRIYVTDSNGDMYFCDKPIERDATLKGGLLHQINYSDTWTRLAAIDGMDDADGVTVLQEAKVEKGVDIIIMGDGFAAEHFLDGNYDTVMRQTAEYFFSVEPYASLRDYFNVYYINAVSQDNHDAVPYWSGGTTGLGAQNGATMGTAVTKFNTYLAPGRTSVSGNDTMVKQYMMQAIRTKGAKGGNPVTNETLVQQRMSCALALVQINVKCYAGTCFMWLNGSTDYCNSLSIAYTPLGNDGTGRQCRLTTVHEGGGHGFAKLADEYQSSAYTASTFSTSVWDDLRTYHNWGVYRNVNEYWTSSDVSSFPSVSWEYTTKDNVYWAELLNTSYGYVSKEGLSLYKGAKTKTNMFCRSTSNSMMNSQFSTNGQCFNAISRWAIWYRVMRLTNCISATSFKASLDEFIAFDKTIDGWNTSSSGNTEGGNYVELFLEPLGSPVIKKAEWLNGQFVEIE